MRRNSVGCAWVQAEALQSVDRVTSTFVDCLPLVFYLVSAFVQVDVTSSIDEIRACDEVVLDVRGSKCSPRFWGQFIQK